jgi:hypothetical protein
MTIEHAACGDRPKQFEELVQICDEFMHAQSRLS